MLPAESRTSCRLRAGSGRSGKTSTAIPTPSTMVRPDADTLLTSLNLPHHRFHLHLCNNNPEAVRFVSPSPAAAGARCQPSPFRFADPGDHCRPGASYENLRSSTAPLMTLVLHCLDAEDETAHALPPGMHLNGHRRPEIRAVATLLMVVIVISALRLTAITKLWSCWPNDFSSGRLQFCPAYSQRTRSWSCWPNARNAGRTAATPRRAPR